MPSTIEFGAAQSSQMRDVSMVRVHLLRRRPAA